MSTAWGIKDRGSNEGSVSALSGAPSLYVASSGVSGMDGWRDAEHYKIITIEAFFTGCINKAVVHLAMLHPVENLHDACGVQ